MPLQGIMQPISLLKRITERIIIKKNLYQNRK